MQAFPGGLWNLPGKPLNLAILAAALGAMDLTSFVDALFPIA